MEKTKIEITNYSKEELVVLKLKSLLNKYIEDNKSVNNRINICEKKIETLLLNNDLGSDYENYYRINSKLKEINNLYVDIIRDLRIILCDYLTEDECLKNGKK